MAYDNKQHTLSDYQRDDFSPKTYINAVYGTVGNNGVESGIALIKSIVKSMILGQQTDVSVCKPIVYNASTGVFETVNTPGSNGESTFFNGNNGYTGFDSSTISASGTIGVKLDPSSFVVVNGSKGLDIASNVRSAIESRIINPASGYFHSTGGGGVEFTENITASKVKSAEASSASDIYVLLCKKDTDSADCSVFTTKKDSAGEVAYYKNGNLYQSSDERLKDIMSDIDVDLDAIKDIRKIFFTWKDGSDDSVNIGVTAQSVEKLYPEIVSTHKNSLSVDYQKLGVIALAAIDKLVERVENLERRVEELESNQ